MTQYLSRAMFGCLALVGCMLSVFPHPTTAWSAAQPSCFVPAMHPGNGQRVCVSATTSSQTLERQVRSFIDTKPAHALKQRNFISAGASYILNRFRTKKSSGRRTREQHGVAGTKAMFTGIVEEMGKVEELQMDLMTPGVTLTVSGDVVLQGAYEGCSIAVNGVCLTVTKFDKKQFTVGVAPETLRLTNLGDLEPGSPVNLERAAAIDGRNSGHMVQGHVDNVGTIVETWPDDESLFVKVAAPKELMRYIVPKGFIAIDGTSLTVCEVNSAESWFTFMLVAYTQQHIIIPKKAVGGKVNLEVDVMSKYVERSMDAVNERIDRLEAKLDAIASKLQ
eukprot:CAMPEP_0177713686 /NCGR_PEP_ID=MMETSP0484_2-20121128/13071_1 /TAXON_ID=354590 /ORGANISM="Rhodomonas lens, Strain RHODO" /LENGTH=334 /DNA_ID=CAMNT_0019225591 /DNA_START=92 /DNA_END=1096 /DNA_ORIENTATION=+